MPSSARLVNTSDEDIDVSIASEGSQPIEVTVPRHGSLSLGEDGENATLSTVTSAPGDVLDVQVSTRATGQNVVSAPVLPALGYYKDVTPAPESRLLRKPVREPFDERLTPLPYAVSPPSAIRAGGLRAGWALVEAPRGPAPQASNL